MKRGDLVAALQDARSGERGFRDQESEWFWRFRALEAEILMLQGHYQDSLDLLAGNLPPAFRGTDIEAWQRLTEAAACSFLSRPTAARDHLFEAKKIIDASQPQLLGEFTLRKGTLAFLTDDPDNAYAAYKTTRDIATNSKDLFLEGAALGSLGLVSTRLERYDESIEWNKKALELSRQAGAINSIARIEGNTGWSYHEMGDLPNALHQFELAEADAKKAGLAADRAYWRNGQAGVLFDLHEFDKAAAVVRDATKLAQDLKDNGALIECLQNRALISIARSEHTDAEKSLEEAARLGKLAPDFNRDLYTSLLRANLGLAEKKFAVAESSYRAIAETRNAFASIRWEAQAGLAQVHAALGKNTLAEKEFAESIQTISGIRNSIQQEEFRLSFLSSAIRFYDGYVNFLLSQHRTLDALFVADRSRAQTLEQGLSLRSISKINPKVHARPLRPQEIARKQNATLFFYWLGGEHSHLWVVTPKGVSLFPLPRSSEINAAAHSYRASFDGPLDPLESANADGIRLYDTLVRPAENLLPQSSRIIILPDGDLNGLNFETLIVSSPKPHYWIDDSTISIANSLSLLAEASNERPPESGNLLLFGAPISPAKEYPPLADAEKETVAVRQHFAESNRKLFLGQDARASVYLSSEPGKYSYLHFATHGVASLTRPLESAIILTREGDSYKLYAREIVQHPLNAYLVSISACNGTGTQNFAGEGLIGLSWAFLRAGAHNVVAGLWEVSTASTPQIMDGLYKGLKARKDPATALRQAKLVLVHSNGAYRRPFYWAPFQLYSGS